MALNAQPESNEFEWDASGRHAADAGEHQVRMPVLPEWFGSPFEWFGWMPEIAQKRFKMSNQFSNVNLTNYFAKSIRSVGPERRSQPAIPSATTMRHLFLVQNLGHHFKKREYYNCKSEMVSFSRIIYFEFFFFLNYLETPQTLKSSLRAVCFADRIPCPPVSLCNQRENQRESPLVQYTSSRRWPMIDRH